MVVCPGSVWVRVARDLGGLESPRGSKPSHYIVPKTPRSRGINSEDLTSDIVIGPCERSLWFRTCGQVPVGSWLKATRGGCSALSARTRAMGREERLRHDAGQDSGNALADFGRPWWLRPEGQSHQLEHLLRPRRSIREPNVG